MLAMLTLAACGNQYDQGKCDATFKRQMMGDPTAVADYKKYCTPESDTDVDFKRKVLGK
jgi:hypothetical protein